MTPKVAVVGVLINPSNASAESQLEQVQTAALARIAASRPPRASNDRELNAAIESLVQAGAGALMAAADPFFAAQRDGLVALVRPQHKVPAMWEWPRLRRGRRP